MCTSEVHTYVYPSGRRETYTQPSLCPASHHKQPCANHAIFYHTPQAVAYSSAMFSGASSYPSYSTPWFTRYHASRSSTPYRSDSAGSSPRRYRDSGAYITSGSPSGSRRAPQYTTHAHTSMPSSPTPAPYIVDAAPRVSTRRPEPRYKAEYLDKKNTSSASASASKQKTHSRQSSAASYDSRWSKTSAEDDARQDKLRRDAEKQRLLNERIARDNAEIASRPAVPLSKESLLKRSHSAAKKRLSDLERMDSLYEQELLERLRRLDLVEKKRDEKRGRLARQEEEDTERRRIRMGKVPTRRATISPASSRSRYYYDGIWD